MYACATIILLFHFYTNGQIVISSMAYYEFITVYNAKVDILKQLLRINETTKVITLNNFKHNYINMNRVAIWKKKELLDLPISFKLSTLKMKEMTKLQLSLFDNDYHFKEFLVSNGQYDFHPPG